MGNWLENQRELKSEVREDIVEIIVASHHIYRASTEYIWTQFTCCMEPTTTEKNLRPPHANGYFITLLILSSCPSELSWAQTSSLKISKEKNPILMSKFD